MGYGTIGAAAFFLAGGLTGFAMDEAARRRTAPPALTATETAAAAPDAAVSAMPSHDRVLLAPGDAYLTVVRSAGPDAVAVGDMCYATWGARFERLGSDPKLGTLVRTIAKGRPTGPSDCAPGAVAFVEDASKWVTLADVEAHEREARDARERRTGEMVAAAARIAP